MPIHSILCLPTQRKALPLASRKSASCGSHCDLTCAPPRPQTLRTGATPRWAPLVSTTSWHNSIHLATTQHPTLAQTQGLSQTSPHSFSSPCCLLPYLIPSVSGGESDCPSPRPPSLPLAPYICHLCAVISITSVVLHRPTSHYPFRLTDPPFWFLARE